MNKLEENDLYFARVKENAIIPTKDDENAGYDIYACFDEDFIAINPNETKMIPTGVASAIHPSKYLQVEERGSTGSKGIKKSAGVIDSGYRGEIFIALTNCTNKKVLISKLSEEELLYSYYGRNNIILYPYNKAIAQLVVHEVISMNVYEISYNELKQIPSNRETGKLGSTGK